MSLPDDIELEAAILAGKARAIERDHVHDKGNDTIVHLQCPLCGAEIFGAVLGCPACIPTAVRDYATHQIIEHWDLLKHAYDRFCAGVGLEL